MDDLLRKWSTPIALATTIFGGSAWLTTTRNDVQYLADQVKNLQVEINEFEKRSNTQDSRLSRIEAKIDMLIDYMKRPHEHDQTRRR